MGLSRLATEFAQGMDRYWPTAPSDRDTGAIGHDAAVRVVTEYLAQRERDFDQRAFLDLVYGRSGLAAQPL